MNKLYHDKLGKRKRSSVRDRFDKYRQRVWQLLQNPHSAAQLRSLTLLQPFDHGVISKTLSLTQFCDVRKYSKTALTQRDSRVDHVLELVGQNAPGLRFFEYIRRRAFIETY